MTIRSYNCDRLRLTTPLRSGSFFGSMGAKFTGVMKTMARQVDLAKLLKTLDRSHGQRRVRVSDLHPHVLDQIDRWGTGGPLEWGKCLSRVAGVSTNGLVLVRHPPVGKRPGYTYSVQTAASISLARIARGAPSQLETVIS